MNHVTKGGWGVLALGVVPVATQEWYGKRPGALFPRARAKLGDAPPPDLIALYAGSTREEYDTLSKIAPTVAQPRDIPDGRADPVYSRLALASGRSFFLSEGNPWYDALGFSSVLSLLFFLEDFVPTLAGGEGAR